MLGYERLPIDSGGHEHEVRSKEVLDERKRNGCSFINTYQFCLLQLVAVTRVDVLGIEGRCRDEEGRAGRRGGRREGRRGGRREEEEEEERKDRGRKTFTSTVHTHT